MNIGGAWIKKDKNGDNFLSCQIELENKKINFLVFKNKKKEGNQPDYRIVLADNDKEKIDDTPF